MRRAGWSLTEALVGLLLATVVAALLMRAARGLVTSAERSRSALADARMLDEAFTRFFEDLRVFAVNEHIQFANGTRTWTVETVRGERITHRGGAEGEWWRETDEGRQLLARGLHVPGRDDTEIPIRVATEAEDPTTPVVWLEAPPSLDIPSGVVRVIWLPPAGASPREVTPEGVYGRWVHVAPPPTGWSGAAVLVLAERGSEFVTGIATRR